MVESTTRGRPASGVEELAGAARGLDLLAGRLREAVGVDGQRLGELAAPEDLDRDVLARRQPGAAQGGEVDGLGMGAEGLERHRHLLVRAAQLAHPHVDRVLAALEAGAVLGAGARAVALVPAAGGLAVARAVAAAHALAVLARAGGGREVVQADPDLLLGLGHQPFSSTAIRCWTRCTRPRSCGESGRSTVWPMRRRPSVRSVAFWRSSVPFADLTCVMASVLTRSPLRRAPRPPPTRPWWSPPRRRWPGCRRARARRRPTVRAAWRSPPGGAGPGGRRSSP